MQFGDGRGSRLLAQTLVKPVQWMSLTGWVLSQTDLRIAHFIGVYQIQLLPAVAALAAFLRWRPATARLALAATLFAAFAAVLWLQG